MSLKLGGVIGVILRGVKNPIQAVKWLLRFFTPVDSEAYLIGGWRYGNVPRLPLTEVFPGIERVDVTVLRTFDRDTGTSVDTKEILVLCAIVKFTQARSILEIGTYNGNTALNLAANSPDDALITTVDLPSDSIGAQYSNTEYSRKIRQVFGDSTHIDWTAMSVPFDIVFIDGCHSYEYVNMDTRNAMRYLKPGGILVWHDYGSLEDVSQVVDETARRIEVKAIQGTRLAVGLTG